jgi:excinuclease ABC subunit C
MPPKKFRNLLAERLSKEFFASLPKGPGVYFMRSGKGEILYVGKASSLRSRVGSYRRVRPGKVGGNIVKLVQRVESITWEEHDSEERAYQREREVIRALVPRYNIADAWEEDYFFIGLQLGRRGELALRLTSFEDARDEGWELHGCYPQRGVTKRGYSALLRLLYAATYSKPARFSFPARLTGRSPCYRYALKTANARRWKDAVSEFLHGRSLELLHRLVATLLTNDLPAYTRPALQRDLETLKAFADAHLASLASLSLDKGRVTSHELLRRAIKNSLV